MLLVQDFIQKKSLLQLEEEHGVFASFSKCGRFASFNYGQLEAKEDDILAQQCRGLILSHISGKSYLPEAVVNENNRLSYKQVIMGETLPVAVPFWRFFNEGQGSAAKIDWQDPEIKIMEKLDGTCAIVYYNPFTHRWMMATRSVPEADLLMDNGIYTFRTLFDKAVLETTGLCFDDYTSKLNKTYTYIFELTTPLNRIVVDYKNYGITLLGARSVLSLQEVPLDDIESFGVPAVRTYSFKNLNEIYGWVSEQKPTEHEGVVVVDNQFRRVKIKSPVYVATSKIRDSLVASDRGCIEVLLKEKDDDILPLLPIEIVNKIQSFKEQLKVMFLSYDKKMSELKSGSTSKKEFALKVQAEKGIWQSPFFPYYDGKISSMKEFIIQNADETGSWSNGFIDKIINHL